MPSLDLGNSVITYEVIKSDRKTLGIKIDFDSGIIVRSPQKLSQNKIKEVLQDKSSWILEKLQKIDEIKSPPPPKKFLSGERFPYLGRHYLLQVNSDSKLDQKEAEVKYYQGKFIARVAPVVLENDNLRTELLQEKFIQWYRRKADKKIKERVHKYQSQLGVEPNNIKIKKQKKRWGSCSSKDNLNFNWKLILAPMSILDYIVVHELAHLKFSNHPRDFWQLVETIIPDYKKRQEWLRINGRQLTI